MWGVYGGLALGGLDGLGGSGGAVLVPAHWSLVTGHWSLYPMYMYRSEHET